MFDPEPARMRNQYLLAAVSLSVICIRPASAMDHYVPTDWPTIQEAVIMAATSGDRIIVEAGTYSGLGNTNVDTMNKAVEIIADVPAGGVVIDCGAVARAFIIESGEGSGTIIDGFTIINGQGTGPINAGGAIYCEGSSPTITSCEFECNQALDAGAIFAYDGSDPTISFCNFIENSATGCDSAGGAVYIVAGDKTSNATFIDCHFESNLCQCFGSVTGSGGAVAVAGSSATFLDCSFIDNEAKWGGGMFFLVSTGLVQRSSFISNDATEQGGALKISLNSTVTLQLGLFSQNTSDDIGGAVVMDDGSSSTFVDVEFIQNVAPTTGGAVYNSDSQPTFESNEFTSNSGGSQGGAIFSIGDTSELTVRDSEFTGNYVLDPFAGRGGAIYNDSGRAEIDGSHFESNNAGVSGGAIYNTDELTPLVITNSTLLANFADSAGGIRIAGYSECYAANVRFLGNRANSSSGGAILIENTVRTHLVNAEFSGNVAADNGGAVALYFGDEMLVASCTLSRNEAGDQAGGLYLDDDCTIANSILRQNSDSTGTNEDSQLTIVSGTTTVDYSDVQGWTGTIPGSGNISSAPLFCAPLGSDGIVGTLDDDLHLTPSSPAIDAGSNALLPMDEEDLDTNGIHAEPLPVDIDSDRRRSDLFTVADTGAGSTPIVDMGADEYCPADLNGDGTVDVIDILILLGGWGSCPPPCPPCQGDVDFNCDIDVFDLLEVIGSWGSCC